MTLNRTIRRSLATLAMALAGGVAAGAVSAETVLRIGITNADIPLTTGQVDSGAEGMRFIGYTLYDALVNWAVPADPNGRTTLLPGLATDWKVADNDQTRWTFTIRRGVKFHDGSEFTAEAAVWNLDKILKESAPQYDPKQALSGRVRIPAVKSYQAVDRYTLEIVTDEPNAFLPYQIAWILMSSPAQWEAMGKSWEAVARQPSGTGPFKLATLVPRQRAELVVNKEFWDQSALPKVDKLVLVPIADSGTRVSALLSGQVDWIEQPAPDVAPRLQSQGYQIVTGNPGMNWVYQLSYLEGSPWRDERVRKAANLAVDREAMKGVVNGLLTPCTGFVQKTSPWYGNPTFVNRYDLAEAKRLLAEAGITPQRPISTKIIITSSESAQARSVALNEYVQQSLADVGIKVEFEVLEWNTLLTTWRAGAQNQAARGATAINMPNGIQDPFLALERYVRSDLVPPKGVNWGHFGDPEMDKLLTAARTAFDIKDQDAKLAKVHERFVDQALFLCWSHDVMAMAVSPKVKGVRHPGELVARIYFPGITVEAR